MEKVKKSLFTLCIAVAVIAMLVVPAAAMVPDRNPLPSGQPFKIIWEWMKDLQNQITDIKSETHTATISFPASALNYASGPGIRPSPCIMYHCGLLWTQQGDAAILSLMRPADWDGVSEVVLSIYFVPTTSTGGFVDFFIRPTSYDPGDPFPGPLYDQHSIPVEVSASDVIQKQTFTIQASDLTRESWLIAIQTGGFGTTYPDDVLVESVGLTYTAR